MDGCPTPTLSHGAPCPSQRHGLPADIGILMDMFGSAFGGVLYNFTDNHLHDLAQGVADSAGFYSGKSPRSLLGVWVAFFQECQQ